MPTAPTSTATPTTAAIGTSEDPVPPASGVVLVDADGLAGDAVADEGDDDAEVDAEADGDGEAAVSGTDHRAV